MKDDSRDDSNTATSSTATSGPEAAVSSRDAPSARAAQGWPELAREGKIGPALRRYQEDEAAEPDAWQALRALDALQGALRDRSYSRAREQLRAYLSDTDTQPALTDWQALGAQLEHLEATSKTLQPRDPEAALGQLAGVTHPVLLAETDTLRGTCFIYRDDANGAQAAFEAALARDPKHHRAMTNLGNLALEAGEVDAAIARYEAALALSPEFSNAHHNLGVAYRRKGQVSRSVRSLRKAQGAQQRRMREEARETLKQGAGRNAAKYGRWLLYGAIFLALYLVLRAQGVI